MLQRNETGVQVNLYPFNSRSACDRRRVGEKTVRYVRVSVERLSAVLLSEWVMSHDLKVFGALLLHEATETAPLTIPRLQYESGLREGFVRQALQVLVGAHLVRERDDCYWLNPAYVRIPRRGVQRQDTRTLREERRKEARAALQALAGVRDGAHHS